MNFKLFTTRCRLGLALLGATVLLGGAGLHAQNATVDPTDTQVFTLRAGWNAIDLRVDPLDPTPGVVFAHVPVDKVATYFPLETPVEFIQNPTEKPWKSRGWNAWFAPALPESAISDLFAIGGGHCYLVHSTAPATLSVVGAVIQRRVRWQADSYNFVGFPVDPVSPPTFQAWFAGSTNHQSTQRTIVYTLGANDTWQPVSNPGATVIQPGAAYWVFCEGDSDYQGPLDVSAPTGVENAMDFGSTTETLDLQIINNLFNPDGVTLQLDPTNSLPLSYQQRTLSLGQIVSVSFTDAASFGSLESGAKLQLRLTLDRAGMTQTNGAAVITVRDDVGSLIRIPVTGQLP